MTTVKGIFRYSASVGTWCGLCLVSAALASPVAADGPQPLGSRVVWQPLTIEFAGPVADVSGVAPNPFLDYRLQVVFHSPSGRQYDVPGFFAADGQGGTRGDVWRVMVTPDEPGRWTYRASFRHGEQLAIDLDAAAGEATAFDGTEGAFDVDPRQADAPGFLKWGRLQYAGGYYLKFAEGPYWIRTGTDSPENFLAYAGFDNTRPSHAYEAHQSHWRPGDPDWGDGRGRGIIGALNYLAQQHVNSVYFLTMNIGGDGKDVWPWIGKPNRKGADTNDNLHFDIAKLEQWETVLAHAQRQGIFLHFVLNEAESNNKQELDGGELGVERKLYYRELIARFAHHLALQWNLCEEYNLQFDLGADRTRQFADYIQRTDPYDHPITVHSAGNPLKALAFTFGDSRFSMTSIQLGHRRIDTLTEEFRRATREAGRPLPISLDEFTVDVGTNRSHVPVDRAERHRREKLWPTLLSGGMLEYILEGLLKVDRFDTPEREKLWQYTWYARKFLTENTPFWKMEPNDRLVLDAATIPIGVGRGEHDQLGAQVLAQPGKVYAIYLPRADGAGTLDLSGTEQTFRLRWYDPRQGTFVGDAKEIRGGQQPVPFGPPPTDVGSDWAVLVERGEIDADSNATANVFPQTSWDTKSADELGLNDAALDALATRLGGRGCIIKNGYVVKAWGSQSERSDWFSSAKPVLSTLLMFALKEGRINSVDTPLIELGWPLQPKDQTMTLRHLASMTSGYARPESPGTAWAYNDFAIQLYQETLFDRIFEGDPVEVAHDPHRFGALGLQDGLSFRKKNRRMSASVRDFARIGWLWCNQGVWNGKPLLPAEYFAQYMRPHVPRHLPQTAAADTNDYLEIGSYGGGSDHFTKYGPGIYGFNWWFNDFGHRHPDRRTWPDAPADTVMSIGFGGNCCAIIPSQQAVLVAAQAEWGKIAAGDASSSLNQLLRDFSAAVHPETP